MDLSFLMVFLKDAPGQTPKLILTLCRRVILIEKSFACSQVVTIASLVSEPGGLSLITSDQRKKALLSG